MNQLKYLARGEQDALLKTFGLFVGQDKRNCALLLLALTTGARATELLNLKPSDLNNGAVFFRGIKNSNDREIPIKPALFKLLVEISGREKVFDIGYQRLVQIWKLYRPAPKKFHSLRHTFAIELYRRTKDIRLVQVALGHKSIASTMVYSQYVYSSEELRKAMRL